MSEVNNNNVHRHDAEHGNASEKYSHSVNLSRATRAGHITPDLERLAKYDEYPAKIRKKKLKKMLWFIIYCGVLPQAAYEYGLLCGAVIVSENPLQIAVMAEVQFVKYAPVCWGVKCFTVNELPLHTIAKGERVPCAVMFGEPMPFAGVWSEMEPQPVCWATADTAVLQKAASDIDEYEWKLVETLVQKAIERDDVDFTKEIAYFNKDLSPRTDLQEKPEKQQKKIK